MEYTLSGLWPLGPVVVAAAAAVVVAVASEVFGRLWVFGRIAELQEPKGLGWKPWRARRSVIAITMYSKSVSQGKNYQAVY